MNHVTRGTGLLIAISLVPTRLPLQGDHALASHAEVIKVVPATPRGAVRGHLAAMTFPLAGGLPV
jgi:hypothetical protein